MIRLKFTADKPTTPGTYLWRLGNVIRLVDVFECDGAVWVDYRTGLRSSSTQIFGEWCGPVDVSRTQRRNDG